MENLRVISRDFEATSAIQEFIHDQVERSLQGHRQYIADFCVRLGDLNGPRGGIDKYCSVSLQLRGVPDVFVRAEHVDLYAAITDAIRRATLSARRTIEKSQDFKRPLPFEAA